MAIVRVPIGNPLLDRRVRLLHSTRSGGVSGACWASFNLGSHVNDEASNVLRNRSIFYGALPSEPVWLQQVHGVGVLNLDEHADGSLTPVADAAYTTKRHRVVCIQTADCLPIVVINADGRQVGAAHAGWRGLSNGVIEALLHAMPLDCEGGTAWLGPAIGPTAFEVGSEVREQFLDTAAAHQRDLTQAAFTLRDPQDGGLDSKYLADIYALARLRLSNFGISAIMGADRCTYRESADFFSYRRDGQTGRMASCVWIENEE
jgi:polyphenol oxidase